MLSLLACALPPPPPPSTAARDELYAEHGTLSLVEGEIFTLPADLQLGWQTHDPEVVEVAGTQLLASGAGRSHLQLRRGGQTHLLDVVVAALPFAGPPVARAASVAALPRHTVPAGPIHVTPDLPDRTVLGALDASVVDREIHAAMPRIEACFNLPEAQDALLPGPTPVSWKFVIDAHGDVFSVRPTTPLPGDDTLNPCVTAVLRGLSYPAPRSSIVIVDYSFIAT